MTNLHLSSDGFISTQAQPFAKDQIVFIKGHGKTEFKVIGPGLHSCVVESKTGRRMVSNKLIRKTSRST